MPLTLEEIVNGLGTLDPVDIKSEIDLAEKKLGKLRQMLAVVEAGDAKPPKSKGKPRSRQRTVAIQPAQPAAPDAPSETPAT